MGKKKKEKSICVYTFTQRKVQKKKLDWVQKFDTKAENFNFSSYEWILSGLSYPVSYFLC